MKPSFASWNKPAVSILFLGSFVALCTLLWNPALAAENKYMKDMGVSVGETSVPSGEGVSPSDVSVGASDEYVTPSDEGVLP